MYIALLYFLVRLKNKLCEFMLNLISLIGVNLINILTLIIFLIMLFYVIISIKYPFWNRQPIFHKYDYWRKFYKNSFIIKNDPVKSDKYFDYEIKTYKYDELKSESIDKLVTFIQSNYFNSENMFLTAMKKTFELYFTGQSDVTLVSVYKDKTIEDSKIKACITSSSINLHYQDKYLNAYYLDNICVDKDLNRDRNITYKLIQTHERNQRKINSNIKVSLFKKEIKLCDGIIPLVKFETYLFKLKSPRRIKMPSKMICKRIHKTNYYIIRDFLEKIKKNELSFEFNVYMDIRNVIALLESEEYYMYCLMIGKKTLSYYFFKNNRIIHDDYEGETLQMIGSYNNTKSIDLFTTGYFFVINEIIKMIPFKMLLFSKISHNAMLFESISQNYSIISKFDTGYYLYNYIIPKMPLPANDCFILI